MRFILFLSLIFVSSLGLAKNKIVFGVVTDPKKKPDLYVLMDYKKGVSTKRFIESEISNYETTEEFIVYTKDATLYLVKDFDSLTKNTIASNVASFKIKNGQLYYETIRDVTVRVLWVISDFKTLTPLEIMSGHASYALDE